MTQQGDGLRERCKGPSRNGARRWPIRRPKRLPAPPWMPASLARRQTRVPWDRRTQPRLCRCLVRCLASRGRWLCHRRDMCCSRCRPSRRACSNSLRMGMQCLRGRMGRWAEGTAWELIYCWMGRMMMMCACGYADLARRGGRPLYVMDRVGLEGSRGEMEQQGEFPYPGVCLLTRLLLVAVWKSWGSSMGSLSKGGWSHSRI